MQIEAKETSRIKAAVEFDLLTIPTKPRVLMRRAAVDDLETIYRHIERYVPGPVAPPSTVRQVMGINSDSVVVFLRNGEIIGFCAMLMLNARGLEGFLTGQFKPKDPQPEGLAPTGTAASAVYQWLLVAPRLAGEGMLHVAEMLRQPLYRNADVYSRPVTADGLRISLSLGFIECQASSVAGVYKYTRMPNRRPLLADAA